MAKRNGKTVEVRAFGLIVPLILDLEEPTSGSALAGRLKISCDEVEVIIVNGKTRSLEYIIKPGDCVAFVPWGTPGPYRLWLEFIYRNRRQKTLGADRWGCMPKLSA